MEEKIAQELKRQVVHFLLGIIALAVLLNLGRNTLMAALFLIVVFGFVIVNQLLLGKKIKWVQWFVERFERPHAPFPGWGSACYAMGSLFLVGFLHSVPEIAASIVIIAFGDSLSTIIGKIGRVRLPWSERKTVEGSVAFFIASLPAYHFVGPIVIPIAIIAAIIESIDFPLDDNIIVPIACTMMFLIV